MLSLQSAAVSTLAYLPTKCYSFSSIKTISTAGRRTGEGAITRSCLAVSAVSGMEELRPEMMPKHVAIILDGNGRWAMKRGLAVQRGHEAGTTNVSNVVTSFSNLGIKILTVYAFSSENWSRPQLEVDFLMKAFEGFLRFDIPKLIKRQHIRFFAIGNLSRLPEYLQAEVSSAEEMSRANYGMHFVAAVSHSGRDEIVAAAKEIATKVEHGTLRANEVDETMFEQHLSTSFLEFPNPDLLIRTSGELRISNFLLWQLAYTEFFFFDKLFPDFGEDYIVEALASYQKRNRRYGQRPINSEEK